MTEAQIWNFVRESNSIERIFREPTQAEVDELKRFIALTKITVEELEAFVKVYQPDARLRDAYGLNVRVGKYYPPFGSPDLRRELIELLEQHNVSPWIAHMNYERLHPFTDGNGRSGRALWLWKTKYCEDGFLVNFYFQTLQNYGFYMPNQSSIDQHFIDKD